MALNLKLRSEPMGRVQTSRGEYCVFHATGQATHEPPKALGKRLAECDPAEFVRQLARFLLFPAATLLDGKFKPEEPVLTPEDLASLTPEDLEAFATVVVEKEDYLTKKMVSHPPKDEGGKRVIAMEYGEVERPRLDAESSVHYLHRLFVEKEKDGARRNQELLKSMSGLSGFSNSLSSDILKSLSEGASLSRQLGALRPPVAKPVEEISTRVDMGALFRDQQEAYRRPFRDLAKRIDELTEVSVKSSEFLVASNEIQTRIAAELKGSGDQSASVARINFGLTWVVIALTVLGILLPTYFTYRSEKAGAIQQARVDRYIEKLSGTLTSINDGLTSQNTALRTENEQLRANAQALEQRVVELEKRISTASKAQAIAKPKSSPP